MSELPPTNMDTEREEKILAKIAGIKGNPGEERPDDEIRAQAEREVDEGIEVN